MAAASIATDPAFPPGRAAIRDRVPGPSTTTNRMQTMNDQHGDQQPQASIKDEMERLELRKIRLETQLIEAGMRFDRFRLVLDIVEWSVIGAAVAFAYITANHAGLI